jgi:hypothetical protein
MKKVLKIIGVILGVYVGIQIITIVTGLVLIATL